MRQLIYTSTAVKPFSDSELDELLVLARSYNRAHSITGILLYDGDTSFIQALEGPGDEVNKLYDSIKTDARHKNLDVIHVSHIKSRRFTNWSMYYKSYISIHLPSTADKKFVDFSRAQTSLTSAEMALKFVEFYRDTSI